MQEKLRKGGKKNQITGKSNLVKAGGHRSSKLVGRGALARALNTPATSIEELLSPRVNAFRLYSRLLSAFAGRPSRAEKDIQPVYRE